MSTRHQGNVTIRVLAAWTGASYKISLHPSELTVANVRGHLGAAVPPSDQILLIGPPYKVLKDSILQSDSVLAALRIGDAEDEGIGGTGGVAAETADSSTTRSRGAGRSSILSRRRLLLTSASTSSDRSIPASTVAAAGGGSSSSVQQQQQLSSSSSSSSSSSAKRLFLFSKRLLSDDGGPDPQPCRLEPMELVLPTEPPSPSPATALANLTIQQQQQQQQQTYSDPLLMPSQQQQQQSQQSQSQQQSDNPLHQALAAYERQFMLHLAQGRVLADGADLRLAACRNCVKEQAVIARALRAAVSNLSDHYGSCARTRAEFTTTFHSKTSRHSNLLQGFETILTNLGTIQLHPALVSIARSSGRGDVETLLDTVPVDRERNWMRQCQTSHQRLMSLFNELDTAFAELRGMAPSAREEEARQDRLVEEEVEGLWGEVETTARSIRDEQSRRLEKLTSDHANAVKIVMKAIGAGNDDEVQAAFTPLREISNASKGIVPAMIEDDKVLKDLMVKIADAKTRATRRMKVRLRDVSSAQSSIQRVLSSVGVLRDALARQSENMVHLEHVAELPTSYREFLNEIRRRRAFGRAVAATANAMMERLAAIRDDEVKAREKFLRGPGRHLMPAFYEIFAPTLALPPPLFTPQLPSTAEVEALPDVGMPPPVDESLTTTTADAVMEHGGVSSASSLTAAEQQPGQPPAGGGGDDQEASMGSATGSAAAGAVAAVGSAQQQQQQDQLIVSASEQSGNDDLILDPAAGAAVEAEAKALAYENFVLRQAVERLGGKPPRTYVEEARVRQGAKAADEAEVAKLRAELAEAKIQAKTAKSSLEKVLKEAGGGGAGSQLSDKISHSSFEIGDVGLFMPTGRGSGGKRTYLAFHTKCPYRFLSTDCIKGTPDFVLGRIVYQEELVAGELGTDANPYGLPVGTSFWVLTVEVLTSSP